MIDPHFLTVENWAPYFDLLFNTLQMIVWTVTVTLLLTVRGVMCMCLYYAILVISLFVKIPGSGNNQYMNKLLDSICNQIINHPGIRDIMSSGCEVCN